MTNYGDDRQQEVYAMGMLAGEVPKIPPRFEDLETVALENLSDEAYAYVKGSAGSEDTARENRRAFRKHRIVPRMLRGVAERDLSVDLLNQELPVPLVLAPIGVQSILHEGGELATARAAREVGVPTCLSSASSETLEDVSEELGETPKWFQLYWSSDRDVAASFVERAEDAGYEALVVTLDTPTMGWRERDIEHAYLPFLDGEGVANYLSDPAFRESLSEPPEENMEAALTRFLDVFGDASLTWSDLDWLTDQTDLPVVLKGILHPEDAQTAVEKGADGVIVSNHGGRQVDNAIAALDALPRVVDAVGDDATVLFDSGVRRGADVVVALALGAEAVLLGRPYVYGLAIDGADGVEAVLRNVLADLDLTLALAGHSDLSRVDESLLADALD